MRKRMIPGALFALFLTAMTACAWSWEIENLDLLALENALMRTALNEERERCISGVVPTICELEYDAAEKLFMASDRALKIAAIAHSGSEAETYFLNRARVLHDRAARLLDEAKIANTAESRKDLLSTISP